jgi:alpha-L-rhamnosidase
MALGFDLLPEAARGPAERRLVDLIETRGWHLSTGFLGVNLLLPVLTEIGRADVAYRLLQNTTYPSWGYSIVNGATTIWERWNSYTKEKGFGNPRMNSFNHYAYGSAVEWLFRTVAGIDTEEPGFRKLVIRPRPGGGLRFARASYDSLYGRIATDWRLEKGRLVLEVAVPPNTTARIHVPASRAEQVREGGRPAAEAPGVSFLGMEDGAAVYAVGSGSYRFEVRS